MKQEESKKKAGFWKDVRDFVSFGLLGFLLAVLLVTFSFQLLHVPSKSMLPNLEVGDRIVVSKWAYGYSKHSLPHIAYRLLSFLPDWYLSTGEPQRGDVAVFRPPSTPNLFYVKRIIGLPGDRLVMKNNKWSVNGVELTYLPVTNNSLTWQEQNQAAKIYAVNQIPGFRDTAGPFIVPAHHYFVLGDNRPFSKDSRSSEVGTIPRANLVGRVDLILYSLTDNVRGPGYFWDWSGFNSSRFFKKVDN